MYLDKVENMHKIKIEIIDENKSPQQDEKLLIDEIHISTG
jgi:hypothetical protein